MPAHVCQRWSRPPDYFGSTWPSHYSAGFGQSRDSGTLERCNFQVALEALKESSTYPDDPPQVVSEGHWAVGWVEWIALNEADLGAVRKAKELCERANESICLDFDKLSEMEFVEASEAWESTPLKERIALCKRAGVSIFAARKPYIPPDDNGYIMERLLGH